jgi:hypothetical protein
LPTNLGELEKFYTLTPERGAKTRKNSVRTNHTFFREARHPFVYPARQRLQHISPISDLLESRSVIGVFSRAGKRDGQRKPKRR